MATLPPRLNREAWRLMNEYPQEMVDYVNSHPMTQALHGDVPAETAVDDNTVYLELGNQRFECRRVSVSWQMMKFAVAQRHAATPIPHPREFEDDKHREMCKSCADVASKRNEAGMTLMAVMHDTLLILLRPSERNRFEEFMSTAELEPEELENAIGEVIAKTGSQGKAKGTSSHSSRSEEKTQLPSRTVSLSRGTVEYHEAT